MIARLSGRLMRKRRDDLRVVVEVNGVGYQVLLPFFVRRSLDDVAEGEGVELEIYYHTAERQPGPVLIGFRREHERTFFEKLIKVKNVGPTTAAAAMIFSVSTMARAIEEENVDLLRRMPGIGERTARNIVAELKGKVAQWALLQDEGYSSVPTPSLDMEGVKEEVVELLVGLGHRRAEARAKVDDVMRRNPRAWGVEEMVREVFRSPPVAGGKQP
ncbi:MAG: Holliday junction branch migration protein RuvA [Chloroflexi bacterium]|nr:Holliday junction branch migration protein RuvA [Chloroflexota bacterium]